MSLTILLLMASALLIVFAFGLTASVHDALYLLRRPGALVRAILAMGVLMPMFAIAVVSIFDLDPAVKIALVALSVSPIIPILPTKLMQAGAAASYAMGLLVAAGVLAVVLVPAAMEILGLVFNLPLQMPAASVATLTFITLLLPFGLGVAVHHFLPGLAKRLAKPISQIAGITVVVFFFAVFFIGGTCYLDARRQWHRHQSRRICAGRPSDRPLHWRTGAGESRGPGPLDWFASPGSRARDRPGQLPRSDTRDSGGALVPARHRPGFDPLSSVGQAPAADARHTRRWFLPTSEQMTTREFFARVWDSQ